MDTIFHGTKVPIRTWLMVLFEMAASKNGVSAREIERKYDLTAKTAWYLCHRIREAMQAGPLADLLQGTIVADETYIGGAVRKSHQHRARNPGAKFEDGRKVAKSSKTVVFTLVHKESGEARSSVIPSVDGSNLRSALEKHIDVSGSVLHTDEGGGYHSVGKDFKDHQTVTHGLREYVRGEVSTNQAENFFSQLKRSIDGTHHKVSEAHLPRYLSEFDFRYSTRKMDDDARTRRLVSQVAGRRLMYRDSTGGGAGT